MGRREAGRERDRVSSANAVSSTLARSGPMPWIDWRSCSEAAAIAAMDPNSASSASADSRLIPGIVERSPAAETAIGRLPLSRVARRPARRCSCRARTDSQSAVSSGDAVRMSRSPLSMTLSRDPRRARGRTGSFVEILPLHEHVGTAWVAPEGSHLTPESLPDKGAMEVGDSLTLDHAIAHGIVTNR